MRKLISTLMLGALVVVGAKSQNVVVLDPADANTYGTLPTGVTVIDTLDVKCFRVQLNGWSTTIPTKSTLNLGTDTYIYCKVLALSKDQPWVATGAHTYKDTVLTFANTVAFVQPMLADGTGGATSIQTAVSTADAWSEIYTSNGSSKDVNGVQIAVQDKGYGWGAAVGPVLYVSKIYTMDDLPIETVSPETFYTAHYYDDIVTLDGVADEYGGAALDNINRPALTTAGVTGASGTLQMLWDDDYLYVMANVTDATVVTYPSESTQPWVNDGIEIFADIKDRFKVGARLTSAQPQIRFNVDRKTSDGVSDSCDYGGLYDSEPAMKWAFKRTSEGYGFEVGIPWTGLIKVAVKESARTSFYADSIKAGKTMAFEISILDADKADNRVSIMNWSNNTGEDVSYTTSENFGQITLAESNTAVKYTSASAFRMYPNPASSVVSISAKGLRSVEIVNVSGQVVAKKLASSDNATVGVAGMKAGIYFVKVYDANGYVGARKLMVK
jgi:hypothetical protein